MNHSHTEEGQAFQLCTTHTSPFVNKVPDCSDVALRQVRYTKVSSTDQIKKVAPELHLLPKKHTDLHSKSGPILFHKATLDSTALSELNPTA